jgi:hypothetical protein
MHAGGPRAVSRRARDDSLSRAHRRRGSGPVRRRGRRRGRARRAPGRPDVPARGRARRRPRPDAGDHVPRARHPRRTRSRSGSQRWRCGWSTCPTGGALRIGGDPERLEPSPPRRGTSRSRSSRDSWRPLRCAACARSSSVAEREDVRHRLCAASFGTRGTSRGVEHGPQPAVGTRKSCLSARGRLGRVALFRKGCRARLAEDMGASRRQARGPTSGSRAR